MSRSWFRPEQPKDQRCRFAEKGQSAVELAIAVPILILLLLAVADFGRVFLVSVAVNNAARAGAQYGSQTTITATDFTGMVAAANRDGANVSNWNTPTATACTCGPLFGDVTACPTTGSNFYCKDSSAQTTYVTVNTSATFSTILPYPGVPSSMTLTGQAIMQVQQNN